MAVNSQQIEVHWDQTDFEKLRATWSPERIAEDDATLQGIFNRAASVPTLKQVLDWAEAHNIKFFVDYTATKCAAYYTPGTGVVAITKKYSRSPEIAVRAAVHEIRHAWQDYHGYASSKSYNMAERFIVTALKEADADAFGKKAADEYKFVRLKWLRKDHPERVNPKTLQTSREGVLSSLGEKFMSWFSDMTVSSSRRITECYGDTASKRLGRELGVYDDAPPHDQHDQYELPPPLTSRLKTAKININHEEDVLKLGKGFTGAGNYLAQLSRDVLFKQVLSHSLADTFHGAANDEQRKLVTEIRKAYLQKKLARRLRELRA